MPPFSVAGGVNGGILGNHMNAQVDSCGVPQRGRWERTKGAMEALRVSQATLWRWRNNGRIGFRKVGGASFYDVGGFLRDLEQSVEQ